jgi:hypothetical protein
MLPDRSSVHPEFETIGRALDTVENELHKLRERKADVNYISMDGMVASIKVAREAFKVVVIQTITSHGKLD